MHQYKLLRRRLTFNSQVDNVALRLSHGIDGIAGVVAGVVAFYLLDNEPSSAHIYFLVVAVLTNFNSL